MHISSATHRHAIWVNLLQILISSFLFEESHLFLTRPGLGRPRLHQLIPLPTNLNTSPNTGRTFPYKQKSWMTHIPSIACMVYLPTWMVDLCGFLSIYLYRSSQQCQWDNVKPLRVTIQQQMATQAGLPGTTPTVPPGNRGVSEISLSHKVLSKGNQVLISRE